MKGKDNKKNNGVSLNKPPRKCECNECIGVNHLIFLSATVDSFYQMIINCDIVSPTLNILHILFCWILVRGNATVTVNSSSG